jgi:hypothetical protein
MRARPKEYVAVHGTFAFSAVSRYEILRYEILKGL